MGKKEQPRLCVFRSNKHIYAQVINDEEGKILFQVSTLSPEFKEKKLKSSNKEAAFLVGELLAQKAKEKQVEKVSFDKGGYKYHGRVKALAEGVRKGGVIF